MELEKYFLFMAGGDSAAGICDRDGDFFILGQMRLHHDLAARRSELQRIMEEVVQHLFNSVAIGSHRRVIKSRGVANGDLFIPRYALKIP